MLEQRGKVTRFLNSTEDTDKLSGLADDIHGAMMDYQVCPLECSLAPHLTFVPDIVTARYLRQELSAHRKSRRLSVCSCVLTRNRKQPTLPSSTVYAMPQTRDTVPGTDKGA